MRNLAVRLLALEEGNGLSGDGTALVAAASRVCEQLKGILTTFAGTASFSALFSRALVIAQADIPSFRSVTFQGDCSLTGLEELTSLDPAAAERGTTAVIAEFLNLLATFIGTPLTMALLRDAWPAASIDPPEPRSEEP